MKKVLGIGNALVDILVRMDNEEILHKFNLPRGTMQLVDFEFSERLFKAASAFDIKLASGGSAANTIHGLAKLNIPAGFIGCIGRDDMGRFFKQDMSEQHIEPFLFESDERTGRAMTFISPDSERTFGTYLGAAVGMKPSMFDLNIINRYDYLYVEGYLVQDHELIESAVKMAAGEGLKVVLDLASYNIVEQNLDFLRMLVTKYVDIVFANEEESKSLTGMAPEEGLTWMAEHTEIAIVKIGENGSIIKSGSQIIRIPAILSSPVDTTGAGDLYAAGFLYGLTKEYSLQVCGQIGSLLAGKIIEDLGTKMNESRWEETRKGVGKIVTEP